MISPRNVKMTQTALRVCASQGLSYWILCNGPPTADGKPPPCNPPPHGDYSPFNCLPLTGTFVHIMASNCLPLMELVLNWLHCRAFPAGAHPPACQHHRDRSARGALHARSAIQRCSHGVYTEQREGRGALLAVLSFQSHPRPRLVRRGEHGISTDVWIVFQTP